MTTITTSTGTEAGGGESQPSPATDGTIDVTNLVDAIRDTWVKWSTAFIMAAMAANPYLSWTAYPIINPLIEFIVNILMTIVSKGLEMEGFFLNTAIRKASQAGDFIAAKNALHNLPPTTSEADYEKAEKLEMQAFSNLVRFTN